MRFEHVFLAVMLWVVVEAALITFKDEIYAFKKWRAERALRKGRS